jgi:hypothetical protein
MSRASKAGSRTTVAMDVHRAAAGRHHEAQQRRTHGIGTVPPVFVLVMATRVVVAYGITGALVSTHGGRHMGATRSAMASVPEMVEICQGHAEGSLDSGRRRGSDVCKA